jgi:hypothetical protein
VPASTAAATLTATYNDLESVKALFEANKGQIAGVILEPVVGNSGFIVPKKEFLQVRAVCVCVRVVCGRAWCLRVWLSAAGGGGAAALLRVHTPPPPPPPCAPPTTKDATVSVNGLQCLCRC